MEKWDRSSYLFYSLRKTTLNEEWNKERRKFSFNFSGRQYLLQNKKANLHIITPGAYSIFDDTVLITAVITFDWHINQLVDDVHDIDDISDDGLLLIDVQVRSAGDG